MEPGSTNCATDGAARSRRLNTMDRIETAGRDASPSTSGPPRADPTFLAEASRLLAGSLDYETTLATVAAMALPHLGAWCFVDVREPGGGMRRLAVVHPDAEKQELARRLEIGWPPAREDPFGLPQAVRTRQSEVIAEVTDEMLIRASRSDENLRLLRQLGIRSLMVVPLIARGEVLGAITYVSPTGQEAYGKVDLGVAEDLAARCAIAIDNALLYEAARDARDDAQEASRAKSEFLATMSHEIRTPINAVVGYVDLLETGVAGELTAEQGRYLERIQASSRHLLGLINDVLDLARVEADRIAVQLEEAVVGPVVDAALDLVRPLADGRDVAISSQCEGDAGAGFVGDVDRVRQIVVNLLTNAVKFTPDGGRIRISCGHGEPPDSVPSAADSEPWTFVRVEDTGIGIEADELSGLFEPFIQADTGYTRSQEGSGLGLAISRRLARLMHGEIAVESRPGEGSVFTLWLPGVAPAGHPRTPSPAVRRRSLGDRDDLRGVEAVGERMLGDVVRIARMFRERVRARRLVPHAGQISDALVQDHTVALLAALAETLIQVEHGLENVDELLRDGGAILRTIADRHGLQRHRIGWIEEALDAEYDLLQEVVEQTVRSADGEDPRPGTERGLRLLAGLLQQARRGSLRAYRMAARNSRA
jgi:signal transduction histidine kinase